MGLSIGLVGLANVGKSTTFNALTKEQNAQSANYPFCTIEPNKAIVPVFDARLAELGKIVSPERYQYATVEFVDIAGLVRGASKGEGMGNAFLANIRECDAILHIVRCFKDDNITHVEGSVDPLRDASIIETELILADIATLEKARERFAKLAKGSDKDAKARLDLAQKLLAHLNEGKPAINFLDESAREPLKDLRLLTAKKTIYIANVDEAAIANGNEYSQQLARHAEENQSQMITICSKLEEDMAGLSDDERLEFLQEAGVQGSGLDKIVQSSYDILGLMSYFTAGVKEVRAWTIRKNTTAPKAAAAIHNDFEKGFIKAEVISYADFIACGGEAKAKEAGKMRLEGKDYIVQDGDVMHFRFNV